ncbi:hypothetical protein K2173_024296 [Erythroxylum novogranatense]|uniref:RRM domain-containing protein n=1 Tax=Erythroxylum novogranatense TaxID=1862640 RepID=A0AAV8STW1_9ROSI|nr:hypothetical protein K2173_024296 [Erythroxylum novogranatense]
MGDERRFEDDGSAFNGVEEEIEDYYNDLGEEGFGDAVNERKNSHPSPTSSTNSGKLFVGGISWETTRETFTHHFSQYGEIVDSIIMSDRHSGRPRGFGFVTFSDPAVADEVLKNEHVIDGRVACFGVFCCQVEVKRTVPREDTEVNGITSPNKIFIGGIPSSLTEDELKEHFSIYGIVVDHQIMVDHQTGRSRGFAFVTFESEDAIKQILSEGRIHQLGGKQVEIKKAVPKRSGGGPGSTGKSFGRINSYTGGYSDHHSSEYDYNERMGRVHGGYGYYYGYPPNGGYGGGFPGAFLGYSGYGYGFGFGVGGPVMYPANGYRGTGFLMPNANDGVGGYPGGRGRGRGGDSGNNGHNVNGGYGDDKEYGGTPNIVGERYHPYRK